MNFLESRNLETLNNNHVSDEFVKKIISDSKNKPLKLWYGFYFTDPDIRKDIPNAGHAFMEEKQFHSEKYNNKLVHQFRLYLNFWLKEFSETSSIFEAEPPFKFLESRVESKNIKGKFISGTKTSLNNGKLTSIVVDGINKSKTVQHNVDYNIKNYLSSAYWTNSKNRKIGDKKTFIALSEEKGVFEKEVHEILDIKEVNYNDSKDFFIRSKIEICDELNGEDEFTEATINSMNICQEFGMPQMFLKAKLESKEKALEKIIQ